MREGTFVNGNDLANGGNGDADDVFANNVPDALDVDIRGEEFLYPVAQYDHGEGNAIAGGFVYHGRDIPQLQGKFIFGDIVRGRIFVADMEAIRNVDVTEPSTNVLVEQVQLYTVDATGVQTNVDDLRDLVGAGRADLRFGIDARGEIYVMTKTYGFIRRLVSSGVLGDFNGNGTLDLQDYLTLSANLHTDVSALEPAEAYLRGDMNGDLRINFADFAAFRAAYPGSLPESLGQPVPEPSAGTLLIMFGSPMFARARREYRSRMRNRPPTTRRRAKCGGKRLPGPSILLGQRSG